MHQAHPPLSAEQLLALDRQHAWHPYAPAVHRDPLFPVRSAHGCRITLADGRELVDGTASWWSAIHGYSHPALNAAIGEQLTDMAHVMFGGLTHEPAVRLCQRLASITPPGLNRVFLSDSGSVSVEVAIKMALQYWIARKQPEKHRLLTVRGGYHGDTLAAMSVCDPVDGMHQLFSRVLPSQLFAERPACRFGEPCESRHLDNIRQLLATHDANIAAVIIEPIVQGAGGMHFYSAGYLAALHRLCQQHNVLLICDEIATGFGRTGKLFACAHAGISPDILCLSKALTGGMMTLAATLCTDSVADTISADGGVFMHGPTFMANPLACRAALASLDLLEQNDWQRQVHRIEQRLQQGLASASGLPGIQDVRVLGAIGVIEMTKPVDTARWQPAFVDAGVWIRPFGKLVYAMPAYVISDTELDTLTHAMTTIAKRIGQTT